MGRVMHKFKVFIRWATIWITRIVRFITHDIWLLNEQDFSRWTARLVKDVKTVLLMFNTFADQKISYQITALAFRSMLAIVPAIAIAFYLTDLLDLKERFAEILYANLGEERIIDPLMKAADNIVHTAQSGLFGFISMVTFVWIVISLMISVRQVFNNVWKVNKERNFGAMIGVIAGITILSPFVVMLFFSGSVVYSHVLEVVFPSNVYFSEHIRSLLTWVFFAAASILLMSIMYKYIPGTKVRFKYAIKAALYSGLIFTVVQYLYLETQVMVAKQSAVYGVLAAIPLFMVWMNLGWTIVLYGAELCYAFQNVEQHKVSVEMLDKMNVEAVRSRKERLQNMKNL